MLNGMFQVFFFSLLLINDWFRLDINIRNPELTSLFKSRLLSFIRSNQSNIYNLFDPICLKLLTRFRLGLSHVNEQKFHHNFQDCLNSLCSGSLEIEETTHYLLHCQTIPSTLWIVQNQLFLILNPWPTITE